jgi:hypothetical protein
MTDPLARVRRATKRRNLPARQRVDAEWRDAIRAAHAEGATLRAIAEAAGITNPRVHQIVTRE